MSTLFPRARRAVHVGGVLAFLGALFAVRTAAAVDAGDPAPAFGDAVSGWEGGDAVDPGKPDGKTLHVVEFWFAGCPPCIQSVPILGRIQEKYKDKGVVVVGVNNGTDPAAAVTEFRRAKGVAYRTVRDVPADRADDAGPRPPGLATVGWLAGDDDGEDAPLYFPTAFVVAADGTVLWRGSPLSGLEEAVEQAVAGTLSAEQAKARGAAERAWRAGLAARDVQALHRAAVELTRLEPDSPSAFSRRFLTASASGNARDIDPALAGWLASADGKFEVYLQIAEKANDGDDLAQRRPRVAAEALARAEKLAEGQPRLLAQTAMGYLSLGCRDRGLALLDRATAAAPEDAILRLSAARFYAEAGEAAKALALLEAPPGKDGGDDLPADRAADLFDEHRAYYRALAEIQKP